MSMSPPTYHVGDVAQLTTLESTTCTSLAPCHMGRPDAVTRPRSDRQPSPPAGLMPCHRSNRIEKRGCKPRDRADRRATQSRPAGTDRGQLGVFSHVEARASNDDSRRFIYFFSLDVASERGLMTVDVKIVDVIARDGFAYLRCNVLPLKIRGSPGRSTGAGNQLI